MKHRYQQTFGSAYVLESPNNDALMRLFHAVCEKYGIMHDNEQIFAYLQELPERYEQMTLF